MKTINFELSKRLNDLGLLDDIETEYIWRQKKDEQPFITKFEWYKTDMYYNDYKTLTLEEAFEFLKNEIGIACDFTIRNIHNMGWKLEGCFEEPEPNIFIKGKTLLECIEKTIKYLLDNNLIK